MIVVARGLGDVSAQQVVGTATSTATPIAQATLAPTVAATLGTTSAIAIPIIGAAVAAIGFGIEAILNSGCGQSCVITSNWANQAEDKLKANIQSYFAIPAPRPQSVQQAALANFDTVWNYLVSQCSQVSGGAGTNCINDRKSGACKWHAATAPQYPGQPAQGDCWNWFNAYRDPIANDAAVPDAQLSAEQLSAAPSILSGVPNEWLLIGAAAAILAAVIL